MDQATQGRGPKPKPSVAGPDSRCRSLRGTAQFYGAVQFVSVTDMHLSYFLGFRLHGRQSLSLRTATHEVLPRVNSKRVNGLGRFQNANQ